MTRYSPSLSSLVARNNLSESPGIRKQTDKYTQNLGDSSPIVSPPAIAVTEEVVVRTIRKRNQMGYYYNSSEDHSGDLQANALAAQRRVEVCFLFLPL